MASYTLQNENMTAIFSDGLLRSLRLKDQPLEYIGNPENTSYSSILEKTSGWATGAFGFGMETVL